MFLEALRERTRASHRALEEKLDLLAENVDLRRHREILAGFLGFLAPLESHLARILSGHAPELRFGARRKRHLLEQDLLQLGMSDAEISILPRCTRRDLPELERFEEAIGILYVLEGSTLGGQLISRTLGPRLGLSGRAGLAYYTAYGEETGKMWREFCAFVERCGQDSRINQEFAIQAAVATFDKLGAWLCPQKRERA